MKIECTLSSASIMDAANQLRQYAESLSDKTEKLVQSLGEYGVEKANDYLKHDDTGMTRDSIQYTHEGTSGTVSVGGAAVWIEFGTGVARNGGQAGVYVHDKAAELGMDAIGTYGAGHGADPRGWFYYGADGMKHHTRGIESNPFMYQASQDMRRELFDKAKEVFKAL